MTISLFLYLSVSSRGCYASFVVVGFPELGFMPSYNKLIHQDS